MPVVKNFLRFLPVFLIIFLTGCAGQRYHKTVASGPSHSLALPVFAWPLDDRQVLAHFGGKEDGVTLKGLVLRGSEGQNVRAASDGQVVYVDDSLRGYGRTVVLEHALGFSSVYAGSSQILVKVGERVRKGQALARAGRDGKGADPRIYFEVRQDARPLDPELVLK